MPLRNKILSFIASLLPATDLWRAAKAGDIETIRRLIAAGADVNAKKHSLNLEGATPLHIGAAFCQKAAIQELIKLGARISAKDNYGGTPLSYAVSEGQCEDTVNLLLDLGADINAQGRHGQTALEAAVLNEDTQLMRLLLKRGANPNQERMGKKSSPLAIAASGRKIEVLEMLVEAKASVSTMDAGGMLPLSSAAVMKKVQFVRLLLAAGADPNAQDRDGFTALMAAARRKNTEILQILLRAGANPNLENENGLTALDIAEEEKARAVIQLLLQAGAKHGSRIPKPAP